MRVKEMREGFRDVTQQEGEGAGRLVEVSHRSKGVGKVVYRMGERSWGATTKESYENDRDSQR